MDLNTIVENGTLHDVMIALQHGAQVNSTNDAGETPLHIAVCRGDDNIARFLINYGADIDAMNHADDTPMHIAVMHRHLGAVILLIEHGCNLFHANKRGQTAINIAQDLNATEIENILSQKISQMI